MQRTLYAALATFAGMVFFAPATFAAERVDFNRDVRPILSDRCFACHGPDAAQRKGELRLDIEAEAKKMVISPGDLSDSEFWARITHEDVQAVAQATLGHRLIVRPEAEVEGKRAADVIRELLASVPVLETVPKLAADARR